MSRWEFTAKYNLTASHAETMRVSELLDLADDEERAAWKQLSLGYTETLGNSELRESIANTYAGLSAQDVLCFSGAEEGIFVAMNTLLSPDDHAIVITPSTKPSSRFRCNSAKLAESRCVRKTTGI